MAEFLATQLITFVAGAAAAGGATLAVTTAAIQIAAAIGLSYAASALLSPGASRGTPPSDRTFVSRSPTAARSRSYGRVKIAGTQVFAGSRHGKLYRVVAHGEGPIDAVEEHWIDTTQVSVGVGDGLVTTGKYVVEGTPRAHIQWSTGTATGHHYATLEAAFPEWSSDHLGCGVHHSLVTLTQVKPEHFSDVFPNYDRTNYAQVIRGARVYDPRDAEQSATDPATWTWTMNAPLAILDFLTHPRGMGLPRAFVDPEVASWVAAADVADEAVPLAAGGSVPRYQLSGTYGYDERRADVLERMLATCDGRLVAGSGGGLRLSLPNADAPSVTIGPDAVLSYSVGSGNDATTTATVIRAQYTDPAFGYVETDAAPWTNEPLALAFGAVVADAQLTWVPHHAQTRYLMKLAAAHAAPEWCGTLTTNLLALPVLGERYFRLVLPEIDLDIRVETESCRFRLADNATVVGLDIGWVSADPAAQAWNPVTEEGRPPERGVVTTENALPVPADFDVAITPENAGPTARPVALVTWTDIGIDSVFIRVRYRLVGTSTWDHVLVSSAETSATIGPLVEGATYEIYAQTLGVSGRLGVETATITIVAAIDTTPPGVVSSVSATLDGADVVLTWSQPASANTAAARVYRHTVDDYASAALVATVSGGPGTALSYTDEPPAADDYWYWIAATNASLVEGDEAATGSITVP